MAQTFKEILKAELLPALGCTEPIAIALAAAKAQEVLGSKVASARIACSGNIIKNVKAVFVPNSGGRKGIEIAAALGLVSGAAERGLEVLEGLDEQAILEAEALAKKIKVELADTDETLYIKVEAKSVNGKDQASCEVKVDHTRFSELTKNGKVLFQQDVAAGADLDKSSLNIAAILAFAEACDFEGEDRDLAEILDRQMAYNKAISDEGLSHSYGAEVGRTLAETGSVSHPATRAKVMAASGSDARMGGCSLPVVINSGSGNQGLTVSMPILSYAEYLGANEDQTRRALLISNLVAIHQKRFIGKLSAFCGVLSAAAGAGVGICYLQGYDYEMMARVVTNTLATAGGMVCDGAKASCASKIAISLDNMLMAFNMAKEGRTFPEGDGIVGKDVEATIRNVGRMAMQGMYQTDREILEIMVGH